ncbi:M protein, serotype 49-like [Hibiscus syriacus]|uniref:M protein, serotype 49-like n=1 Tax=Hibiscus syriacus TaxID=106335 RepID=UPI001920E7AE|nr:M protein, serotype 49-like [Hibiscus syriacus]
MKEHLKHVPSELEIARKEFEAVKNKLKQKVRELEVDTHKDRVDKLEKEQKNVYFEFEDLRKWYQEQVQNNSNLKRTSEYWKVEASSLKRKFEWNDERETLKEQLKTAQRRLIDNQHQNKCLRIQVADLEKSLKKKEEWDSKTIAELEAIQRVKARDAVIRDFLEKVQKAARHLHGLAREAGVKKEQTPSLPPQALDTHHPHNTRTNKRQIEAKIAQLEENMLKLQRELEDKITQNSQSTLNTITKSQESLVDQIMAKLSGLQQTSAPGAGLSEGVTIPSTPQVVISLGILLGLQGD